jgi:hypothetical protein
MILDNFLKFWITNFKGEFAALGAAFLGLSLQWFMSVWGIRTRLLY